MCIFKHVTRKNIDRRKIRGITNYMLYLSSYRDYNVTDIGMSVFLVIILRFDAMYLCWGIVVLFVGYLDSITKSTIGQFALFCCFVLFICSTTVFLVHARVMRLSSLVIISP